jgi:PAS domain-containing protein
MFEEDKRQQWHLFESERSFRLLVEGVVDYALYMLDPTGIVTSWNIGGQRIKGYSPVAGTFPALRRVRPHQRQAGPCFAHRPRTGPL